MRNNNRITRVVLGNVRQEVMQMPNLVNIQLESFKKFLQWDRLEKGQPLKNQGLEAVFRSTFPIKGSNGDLMLEYSHFELGQRDDRLDVAECRRKGHSYSTPIRARINLVFLETGEIRQKDIYFCDIPLMTEHGTFIINGAERVVVSQIHRSPGVIFSYEKDVYSARIIPFRGSWLEFEVGGKDELIFVRIDRKKKVLATLFLRAIGYDTREKIIALFYHSKTVKLFTEAKERDKLVGSTLARRVVTGEDENVLLCAGEKLSPHDIDRLLDNNIKQVEIVDSNHADSISIPIIFRCLEFEESKYECEKKADGPTSEESLALIYSIIMPGDPITLEQAEKNFKNMFFSSDVYDLGKVGRYKLNKRFDYKPPREEHVLVKEDIVSTIRSLIMVLTGEANIDDIDHLGNRRVRSVDELLSNALKTAFVRMRRIAKERLALKETDTIKPQDIISIKPIIAAIKEFFGSSQLSQFMDQVNPLAELTHKRRLNALGVGGLSRERAGFEVRDVHYTHYGRMCPIETPEGPNIGLIVSMASYARINDYGFLEAPYRKVNDGRVTDQIEYLSAMDEEKYFIAQANAEIDESGKFVSNIVSVRKAGDYTTRQPEVIQFMDVSPKQIISVSASLIPFLEHDDANRALMGSNMQRQSVPLLFPEPPRVGTGMEYKTASDSGVMVHARRAGTVQYVSSERIEIMPHKSEGADDIDAYQLLKYHRTNQDTCYTQRPIVIPGQQIEAYQPIADGPATKGGELALGQNVLVGFVSWNGYNFEDAILVSERMVKDDVFTSIHVKEFQIEVRETKLGPEKITRDIPNTTDASLLHLDEEGVVQIGARVDSDNILVGKVTPKTETETTPEFKLLNSIFGEKATEVRDTSLRVPNGVNGTVIDVQRMRRSDGIDLSPGVSEVVRVLVAAKRKLREGDKMAGRHGNKGVVARILPEEDMPYTADGVPLDVCLNPLGVPSRMNLGQILETQLGWLAIKQDQWYTTPVFESISPEQIAVMLEKSGLSRFSKSILYDGYTGIPFDNPVMVGCMYVLKLHHLVDDKMHARSTGPYSLVTQQPLGGKAQFGGQRLGEMEVWALEAYGASNTLQELLTIKSDDMIGRAKIYESIVKGEPSNVAGVPESFHVLVQELRGLGINISIYDNDNKLIPLTERDEELINREGSNF